MNTNPIIAPEIFAGDPIRALLSLIGNKNPDATAAKLYETFGSLSGIVTAQPEALRKATTPATADKIAAILPIIRGIMYAQANETERINDRRALETYCKSLLYGKRIEEFYIVAVNAQCKVLGAKRIATGSLSEVAAYPRLIVEAALNMNAHSIFLSHNHPGGTCAPSAEDIASTLQIKKALGMLGIMVLDHCIVAGNNTYSMVAHGDIDYRN